MQLNKVLVVYKQVSTSPHGSKGSLKKRVREGNALHLATLDSLYEILKDKGIWFDIQNTHQLNKVQGYDLVITVGGDGTVLFTSHFVKNIPILGIKSFGKQSVGYFCATTGKGIKNYLESIISGKKKPIKLHRLQVKMDNRILAELALNDILFSHSIPASTSKYKLTIGNKNEEHKSSGVWISTAAGSTAAIHSAGGKKMDLTSEKMQYLVREPYNPFGTFKLTKGILSPKTKIKIVSYMPQGEISIDGGTTQYPAPNCSIITIKNAKTPLSIYWK